MKTKKNKLSNFFKVWAMLFGISIFLWNCQNEDEENINTSILTDTNNKYQTISSSEANNFIKKNIKLKKNSNNASQSNTTIDSNSLNFVKIENSNLSLPLFSAEIHPKVTSKAFLIKENGILNGYLYHSIPSKKNISKKFDGRIIITTIQGVFINGYRVVNGKTISRYIKKEKNLYSKMIKDPNGDGDCIDYGTGFCDSTLDEVTIGGGGSSYNSYSIHIFPSRGPTFYPTSNPENINNNGGGSNNNGNGPSVPIFPCGDSLHGCQKTPCADGNGFQDYYGNCVEDDKIDATQLTDKAKCVYNKLLSTGAASFHNMITDLFIEFVDNNIGGRDLTFKMSSNLPNDILARTNGNGFGNFTISINSNQMNSVSSIEIAAALVHEMAHAFLGKHYDDSYSSFSELYAKYINETGIQNYSHDIMKDQFINRMANAIKNYDSTIFSDFEDYKILASQGVFDLSSSQLTYLSQIKNKARQNDSNCN